MNRIQKRLGAGLLSAAITLSLSLPTLAVEPENALSEYEAGDILTWNAVKNFLTEQGEKEFFVPELRPAANDPLTQQEAAAYLLRYAGMKESQLGEYPYDYNYMAESAGLTSGIDFAPEAQVTYSDFMTMFQNAAPLYDALHAERKEPLFLNGMAQPIFDYDGIIRFCVYVETNYDTDGDGKLDLVKALVQLPGDVLNGMKVATIYEARPYITGCIEDTEGLYVDGEFDISALYAQPAARTPNGISTTAEAAENADPDDWYYISPYESDPENDYYFYDYEDLTWYDQYLVRGFGVVECGGLGTKGSEGFETCGTDLEIDAFKCVIEWLTGDRAAYTDRTGNISIEADWSNGNVGMTGRSYAGTTQFGLATTGVKGLKTIVPVAGIASWYDYTNSQGVSTDDVPNYSDDLAAYCAGRYLDEEDYASIADAYGRYLTQIKEDQLASNGDYSDHWVNRDYTLNWEGIQCPALIVHGLNDTNVQTKHFDLMYHAYEKAGKDVKLLLHQGSHITPTYDSQGYEITIDGTLYDEILNRWFSHYLYGLENGIEDMSPVTVQSNVDGAWATYDSWKTDAHTALNGSAAVKDPTVTLDKDTPSVSYTFDVAEDLTIQGPIQVRLKAAAVSGQLTELDGVKLSVSVSDTSDTPFMAFVKGENSSYLPLDTIREKGAWLGGGLENFDLVSFAQTQVSSKEITTGCIDLFNPTAGYDSASAAQRTELESGVDYNYTVYLQPNFYTVKAGHKLVLTIELEIPETTEDLTLTLQNAATRAILPIHGEAMENPFQDVSANAFYSGAVLWAVQQGITSGVSAREFAPLASCSRGEVVTFLWRAMGEPASKLETSPFVDAVDEDAYYYRAMLWAYENGITAGTSDQTFAPDAPVSRGEFVTFLWRCVDKPSVLTGTQFEDNVDADAFYHDAVLWASMAGVTSGTSETTFSPDGPCQRGQVVTFLYRYLAG